MGRKIDGVVVPMVQIPNIGVNIVEMLGVDGAVVTAVPNMRLARRSSVYNTEDPFLH